jgi:hypothetical protein
MRCNICKYATSYVGEGSAYFEEDSCTLCWLTDESEQTENRYGEIGCIFNQRTLDKRRRELDKEYLNNSR